MYYPCIYLDKLGEHLENVSKVFVPILEPGPSKKKRGVLTTRQRHYVSYPCNLNLTQKKKLVELLNYFSPNNIMFGSTNL
jgi:hypothetical protein